MFRKQAKEKLLSQLGPEAPRWAEEYKLSDQHLESLLKTQEKLYEAVSQSKVFRGFPKTELWRLFMDGKDHDKGILGFENERGYMEGMMRGFTQVIATLGQKLDHSSYEHLHDICTDNIRDKDGILLLPSYYPKQMDFGISNNNWSEDGYNELQKKYDNDHVIGRNLSYNPKNTLNPSLVAEKMRLLNNLQEAERLKKEILEIINDKHGHYVFDKRINSLRANIQQLAIDSNISNTSKLDYNSNINKIRQELNNKNVKYFRKETTVIDLRKAVQNVLDDYYVKIGVIGKSRDELEVTQNKEYEEQSKQKKFKEEILNKKDGTFNDLQRAEEIINRCAMNIKYIEKQIGLLEENSTNTLSVADQKLAAAVECCQNLDQLHAFADGNVRTATLVLNKFLIELGEYPCIFDNPNVLDLKSIRELMQYTREGQERFKSYINGEELTLSLPHVP